MISIIIPTYNEKQNIAKLLRWITKVLEGTDHEIIVIDSNSPDETACNAQETAEKLGRGDSVTVLHKSVRKSLSGAVVEGFGVGKGETFVVMDGDLQHPPTVIPHLLKEIEEGADIAIASRHVRGGGSADWTLYRRVVSRVAKIPAHVLVPSVDGVKDPMSGFFAVTRDLVERGNLDPVGFKILLEILVKAKPEKVVEYPFTFESRKKGASKLTAKQYVKYLYHLYKLSVWPDVWKRFVKFAVVGLTGVGVNMGAYLILTRLMGFYDLFAIVCAVELSIMSNFALNDLWTFKDRPGHRRLVRALQFHIVSLFALGIYYGMFYPLTRYFGMYDLAAYSVAIVTGSMWNFGLNYLWTWGKKVAQS